MKEHVWYAGYGSNLYRDRFLCYIQGGKPEGSITQYPGCRDSSLPISEGVITLPYQMYFAKSSGSWDGGGVGFIETKKDSGLSYASIYLITKEQFCDLVKQETKSTENVSIDFDACKKNSSLIFKEHSWYGNLIYVGDKDGHPIFTFTNAENLNPNKPSLPYLRMISSGLKQSHKLTEAEIIAFLMKCPGVKTSYSKAQLEELFS